MVDIQELHCRVEAGEQSAIHSHQSYKPNIYAVCHHSGRYLTRAETNPGKIPFLREQHDFPGFPELDDKFARAAHSREHRHLDWNHVIIQAISMFTTGMLLLPGASLALLLGEFIGSWAESVIFIVVPSILSFVGLCLIMASFLMVLFRKHIYHRAARKKGVLPVVNDFPISGTYEISARERLEADLNNAQPYAPVPKHHSGHLVVKVYPDEDNRKHYQKYATLYQQENVGQHVHAGTIAVENHRYVQFTAGPVELNHRLVLRQPTPEGLTQNYNLGEYKPPIEFEFQYESHHQPILGQARESLRLPLECIPILRNSYTLVFAFILSGYPENTACHLEECKLDIPTGLLPIEHVEQGRYQLEDNKIVAIWRDLSFNNGILHLVISFTRPILKNPVILKGSYRCQLADKLMSGLVISPKYMWDARGLNASSQTVSVIRRSTILFGDLTVDTTRLLQEHEDVQHASLQFKEAPSHKLVDKLLFALHNQGVSISRVEEAIPRLDPTGTLKSQLHYWDIKGRYYHQEMLDSADVHLVVSGIDYPGHYYHPDQHREAYCSQVELYVRCLHDPRNFYTPQMARNVRDFIRHELEMAEAIKVVDNLQLNVHLIRDKDGWSFRVHNIGEEDLANIEIRFNESGVVIPEPTFVNLPHLTRGTLGQTPPLQLQMNVGLESLWNIGTLQELREQLVRSFSLKDIQVLCYDLRIIYDDLPGQELNTKAVELLQFAERHGRLTELLRYCRKQRPLIFKENEPTASLELEVSCMNVSSSELIKIPGLKLQIPVL